MKKSLLLIIGFGLGGLVVALSLTVLLLARSEKGHQLLLSQALPALEESLSAKITIGRTSGRLTGALVWDQVRIVRPDLTLNVD
ncbi:MAG: hypothetical protein JRJ59_07355, partial [Deltaproteobacteria bacterium]|nr:hypothetical protein [Deltaproteobacteria bacterium]